MYSIGTAREELVSHCEEEHKVALNVLASMAASEIAEMHQHMQASW